MVELIRSSVKLLHIKKFYFLFFDNFNTNHIHLYKNLIYLKYIIIRIIYLGSIKYTYSKSILISIFLKNKVIV